MAISVKLTGLPEAIDFTIALPEKIKREALLQMSQAAYDSMQRGADAHTKTGALFQSVYNRQIPNGRAVGHDPERAPHAIFVLFGTRPHEIRPRTRKALRWASGTEFIFAKLVKHPGYAGDDYMTRAATDALGALRQIIDDINVFR